MWISAIVPRHPRGGKLNGHTVNQLTQYRLHARLNIPRRALCFLSFFLPQ
jgi:hypothetical protein